MSKTFIAENISEIQTDDGKRLGLSTGILPRKFKSADTVAMKKSVGFIMDVNGITSPWAIDQFAEIDGEMMALGPWIQGTKAVEWDDLKWEDFSIIVAAARHLELLGFPIDGFYSRAFYRIPGGGLFVLPPLLMAWIRDSSSENDYEQKWERWNHPDLTAGEAWSYSLSLIAWTIITGHDPFEDEKDEKRRDRMRTGTVLPVTCFLPEIKPKIAAIIDASISDPGKQSINLSEWEILAKKWLDEGITCPLSQAEKWSIEKDARRGRKRMERKFHARRWFRQSAWKFAGITAVAILSIIFLWAPVKNFFKEPSTAGMSPMELTKTYYRAMNELDAQTMAECLARGVGKKDRRQVDMLFLTHRIRQGYEGLPDLPVASEWLALGRPPLNPGVWPWGVTNLELSSLADGRIEAQYLLWFPQEISDAQNINGSLRKDILNFQKFRQSWRITDIQRIIGE